MHEHRLQQRIQRGTARPLLYRYSERQLLHFNNVHDLRQKLHYYKSRGHTIVVLIESVYSMDGDVAPVREILDLAESYLSLVVVDEAHGFGVFGPTHSVSDNDTNGSSGGTGVLAMTQCEQHPALLSAIYTYMARRRVVMVRSFVPHIPTNER